jgi:hypothetical protein
MAPDRPVVVELEELPKSRKRSLSIMLGQILDVELQENAGWQAASRGVSGAYPTLPVTKGEDPIVCYIALEQQRGGHRPAIPHHVYEPGVGEELEERWRAPYIRTRGFNPTRLARATGDRIEYSGDQPPCGHPAVDREVAAKLLEQARDFLCGCQRL